MDRSEVPATPEALMVRVRPAPVTETPFQPLERADRFITVKTRRAGDALSHAEGQVEHPDPVSIVAPMFQECCVVTDEHDLDLVGQEWSVALEQAAALNLSLLMFDD